MQPVISPIPLFWWSEIKFTYKEKENYGDLLSKYLVEKISGKNVAWVHPKKQPWYKWDKKNFLAVGSILQHATKDSIIWGSGIIDRNYPIAAADFRAVRGPRTRDYLLGMGYKCPEVYGDPALLLPEYISPDTEKKFQLGIIPHYNDFKIVNNLFAGDNNISVINLMTLDVEDVTKKILECKRTLSSSLHGIIVSQAYGIPSIWVEFSKNIFGDGIKYLDYFESVKLPLYQPPFLNQKYSLEELESLFGKFKGLPEEAKVKEIAKGLKAVCPIR